MLTLQHHKNSGWAEIDISRLDQTVWKFSVADSLDLSRILLTPPTQSCLVGVSGLN